MTKTAKTRLIIALVILAFAILYAFQVGFIGTYDGLNKGFFIGPCDVEIVGVPGIVCEPQ